MIIKEYGFWTHLLLFIIIFCETGLVVTPFLPGDSLLFAAGTFAALGSLDLTWLIISLSISAVGGDTVNYWAGCIVGPKVFSGKNSRFLNREYLDRTHGFYEKYGGKTIIFARFIPIIRTFAPFVAGIGSMTYSAIHRLQRRRRCRLDPHPYPGWLFLRQHTHSEEQLLRGNPRHHRHFGTAGLCRVRAPQKPEDGGIIHGQVIVPTRPRQHGQLLSINPDIFADIRRPLPGYYPVKTPITFDSMITHVAHLLLSRTRKRATDRVFYDMCRRNPATGVGI